jgi:hypothetical protein
MDAGLWTLKCQSCSQTFPLDLKSGEKILNFVKEMACPHCHVKPADVRSDKPSPSWHHVVDFQLPRKKPD